MGFKRHVTYTYETDDHCFPVPFEYETGTEILIVSEDGLTATLGVLARDDMAGNPFEEFDEGEFVLFDGRHNKRPSIEDFKRIIRSNPDRVICVHSCGDRFFAGNVMSVRDTKCDKRTGENSAAENELDSMDGYYIPPDDVTDPAGYAKGAIGQYSAWRQGDVYGVCVWRYTRSSTDEEWGDPDRDSEVWGYYGWEYAEETLKEEIEQ